MVSATVDANQNRCFVLRPNQSLTWRESQVFFAVTALVSLTVATGFAVAGFWPVLPFAGVELLALGTALYVTACRGARNEVVSVTPDLVEVHKGRRGPEQSWEFPRSWARVALLEQPGGWYPSRLLIRSHGREVEVGGFLNEQERRRLAAQLRYALAR